jgi:hypothetical protein
VARVEYAFDNSVEKTQDSIPIHFLLCQNIYYYSQCIDTIITATTSMVQTARELGSSTHNASPSIIVHNPNNIHRPSVPTSALHRKTTQKARDCKSRYFRRINTSHRRGNPCPPVLDSDFRP